MVASVPSSLFRRNNHRVPQYPSETEYHAQSAQTDVSSWQRSVWGYFAIHKLLDLNDLRSFFCKV